MREEKERYTMKRITKQVNMNLSFLHVEVLKQLNIDATTDMAKKTRLKLTSNASNCINI